MFIWPLHVYSFASSDDGYIHDNNENIHDNNENIHDNNGHLQRSYGHMWYRDSIQQLLG